MLANVVYFKSMRSALELTYYADVSVTLCVFVRAHSLQGRRNLGTNGFMNPPKFGPEKHYLNIARAGCHLKCTHYVHLEHYHLVN